MHLADASHENYKLGSEVKKLVGVLLVHPIEMGVSNS